MFFTKGTAEIGEIVHDAFQKPELSKAFTNKNSVSIFDLQTIEHQLKWILYTTTKTIDHAAQIKILS